MLNRQSLNKDLVWEIKGKQFPEQSFGFLKRFESALCLFSGTVSQLYSNYEIVHFGTDGRKVVALPNAFAAHDTFDNIPDDAVEPTGLYIVPQEITNKKNTKGGLLLMYRHKKSGKLKTTPLLDGLDQVRKIYMPSEPFLPVMLNRDLKTLQGNVPAMHLHRLATNNMGKLSELTRADIRSTVVDKMGAFYKENLEWM